MKTESTLYFDGQFWVGVIERHEADRVRAVRIVFAPLESCSARSPQTRSSTSSFSLTLTLSCAASTRPLGLPIRPNAGQRTTTLSAHSAKRLASLAVCFLPLRHRHRFKRNANARHENELP